MGMLFLYLLNKGVAVKWKHTCVVQVLKEIVYSARHSDINL
jgi:hypothetical protein